MKKLFTLVAGALLFISGVHAQQIKGDFDVQSVWAADSQDETIIGITPEGWNSSNVDRIMKFPIVYEDIDRTAETGKSVKMVNKYCGAMGIGANAPAFVSLGTFWSYAWCSIFPGKIKDSDGGVFGGIEFAYRPDSIVGYVKRTHGEANKTEKAQILAYFWTGTSFSTVKQGLSLSDDLEPSEIIDRDRDILGMTTTGVTGNAKLIAKVDFSFAEDYADWHRLSLPINYIDEGEMSLPEKANVIISSADYFNSETIGVDNTLWADDFAFVYNTNLKEFTIDGVTPEFFNEYVTEYQFPINDKANIEGKTINVAGYGKDSKAVAEWQGNNLVITVTDNTSKAKKVNVYTIKYAGTATTIGLPAVEPTGIYGATLDGLGFISNNNESPYRYAFDKEGVAKVTEEGKIQLIGVGEVKVVASQDGTDNFAPAFSDSLLLTVTKAPLTVTMTDATSVYGNTPKYVYKLTGLVNNDSINGDNFEVKPELAAYDNEVKVSNTTKPGVYSIKWTKTVDEVKAYNYKVTLADTPKNLTITKAVAKVSMNFSIPVGTAEADIAFADNIKYDGIISSDKTYNKDKKIDELNADVVKSGGVQWSCEIPKGTPAGKYAITLTTDIESDKYDFVLSENKNILSVKKATTLEVDASMPKTVVYGADSVALKMNTNNTEGEISYYSRNPKIAEYDKTTGKIAVKGVGEAKFQMYILDESANYLAYDGSVDYTLVVTKAPITAKINPVVAVCNMGASLPAFSVKLPNIDAELKNDDTKEKVVISELTANLEGINSEVEGRFTVRIAGEVSANYELKADSATLLVVDPAKENILIEDETSPVLACHIEDTDKVLAPGITPILSFVESGPYWELKYTVKKGLENNKNLKFTFDARDSEAKVVDAGGMWVIMKGEEQTVLMVKETSVLVYDTPITEEASTLKTIHVADPNGVLSEDKAPTYKFNVATNGDTSVSYIYYVKQGKSDNESLKTLVPTFDCTEDYAWLKDLGGDFTKSGSVFTFYNSDYSKAGTSLKVNFEEYSTREPITEIAEILNYTFDNNSDWMNVDGKYDNPTDWASSNPSGTYLGGMYPVTKAIEGENGYVKLSTLSPGYEKPNALIPNIVSGSMFYGAFKLVLSNPLKSTRFGLPIVNGYVTSVKGQFKYKSGETYYNNYTKAEPNKKDNWSVVVVIYEVASLDETLDGTNIATVTDKTIAMGSLIGEEAADWTDFECPVYLLDGNKKIDSNKLYKAAVVFSSSVDGANYNGSIGSELCMDNLTVNYSTEAPGLDPTLINSNAAQSSIAVYPNPVTAVINITGVEAGSAYVVRNIAGGIVRDGELNNAQINVSDLANGVYFLEINGQVVKFIKK